MSANAETWQLMCPDGVFETDLETLQGWIREGRVQRDDKVCKGNLNWIEAYRAPVLRRVFDGEPAATPPKVASAHGSATEAGNPAVHGDAGSAGQQKQQQSRNSGNPSNAHHTNTAGVCHFHPDTEANDICRACSGLFCGACTKKIGGGVIVCPLCGDMCKPLQEIRQRAAFHEYRDSGFGVSDLGESLAYPFKHAVALIVGALVYGVLLLGGFKTQVIGWALLFGCMSQAINHIAVGRKDRDFMPDFSSFSLWDDLIRPALLGVGIAIVTAGPAILLGIMIFWQVTQSAVAKFAPTPQASSMITHEDMDELVNSRDEKKSEEIARKIQNLQQQSRMASPIESLENREVSPFSMMLSVLNIPKWMILALVIAVFWAIFYFPMALAVAGYTESFGSTINPLFGLDAMRRMGATYAKAFAMYLVVEIVGVGLMVFVGMITAPFNMPLVGNLPATFISGTITFYTSLVVACILGLALFKSADRLGIHTD